MSDNDIVPGFDWRVETLRLTAFPAAGAAKATPECWWTALFGGRHEKSTEDVRRGITQLQGNVGDSFMVMTRNPVSFELRQLDSDPTEPPREADALPSFGDRVPTFQRSSMQWLELEDCPPLRRVAFGAILLLPVPKHDGGYEALDGYLPTVTVDPKLSDFLYQVNRRRFSKVIENLWVNRLSKWSTQQVESLTVSSDGSVVRGEATSACRLELDINSVPSAESLPPDRLPRLFEELVALASEIALEGDIA